MHDDPIAELVNALEAGHPPPLAWIVRWSNDSVAEPVLAAWDASNDPHAMLRLLAYGGPPEAVCTILQIALDSLDELLGKLRADAFGFAEYSDLLWYTRYLRHLARVHQLDHALGVLARVPRCAGPDRPNRRTEIWMMVAGALRHAVREPPALEELLRTRRAA